MDLAISQREVSPRRVRESPSQTSSNSILGGSSQQQTFSGPSFQYDAHRQQTGLPVGGLANTHAVNQTSGLNHSDGQRRPSHSTRGTQTDGSAHTIEITGTPDIVQAYLEGRLPPDWEATHAAPGSSEPLNLPGVVYELDYDDHVVYLQQRSSINTAV